jgi:hypothetical protein
MRDLVRHNSDSSWAGVWPIPAGRRSPQRTDDLQPVREARRGSGSVGLPASKGKAGPLLDVPAVFATHILTTAWQSAG